MTGQEGQQVQSSSFRQRVRAARIMPYNTVYSVLLNELSRPSLSWLRQV
ncbi:hypothetical protein P9222_12775 [Paenibacillus amylolyticus]|nr:hypothetical protein [Paenibacillus amylolyticus]WFR64847.1 hypothetical protein P9222_12775 [Paenibacillus amylolyticus]